MARFNWLVAGTRPLDVKPDTTGGTCPCNVFQPVPKTGAIPQKKMAAIQKTVRPQA